MTALAIAASGATPAAAHGVDGVEASNYETRLRRVTPKVDGVTVRVIEEGSRLEVANDTADEVIVLGYEGEPYLRIGRDGVFTNKRSPATYLNESRFATRSVPDSADAEAEPEWEKVSDEAVARWHDHRAHWMGEEDPPEVQAAPDRIHVVYDRWEIPLTRAGRDIVVSGDLRWIPPPSGLPYWVLAAAALAVTLAVAFTGGYKLPAVLATTLVALDVVHVAGVIGSKEGPLATKVGELAIGSFISVTAWIAGAIGVWLLVRREDFAFVPLGWSGFVIALFGGIVDIGHLTKSQVPFAFPAVLARISIAVALGAGAGFVVAAFKRSPRPEIQVPEAQTAAPS